MKTSGKMNLTCSRTEKLAWEYLEGGFDQDLRLSVERHLDTCPGCQKTFQQMRLMMEALEQQKSHRSSPFLATRILNRLETGKRPDRKSYILHKPVWGVAAVVAVILTGVLTGSYVSDTLFSTGESMDITDTGVHQSSEPFLAEADYYVPGYEFLNE